MAKGYVVVLLDVADPDAYAEYARKASQIEDRYGGRALVAADADNLLEGSWPSERVVVLEFPSTDAARAWFENPEYQAVIPLRHKATDSNILLVEGFDE
jgi:uncharacterized protein (DUF1330 family)